MTKKPYDWEGVKRLPLGTKFTDGERTFYFTYERGYRELLMVDKNGVFELLGVSTEMTVRLMMQDNFEVVDCKHDEHYSDESGCSICGEFPKLTIYYPCREYVTLGEALANVATGKWKQAAYDSDEWRDEFLRIEQSLCRDALLMIGDGHLSDACSEKYQDAKWYEVKE